MSAARGHREASSRAAPRAANGGDRTPAARPSASALVRDLERSRRAFDAQSVATTRAALAAVASVERLGPKLLMRLHDALLFIAAYPPSAAVHDQAERELGRVAARAMHLAARSGDAPLENSGLPGSTLATTFSLTLTGLLATRHPDDLELLEVAGDASTVMSLFAAALDPIEREQLSEETPRWNEWLARYAGGDRRARLRRLVLLGHALPAAAPLRETLFAAGGVFVRWRLRGARTLATARVGQAAVFVHRSLQRLPLLRPRDLKKPVRQVTLDRGEREALQATAQEVLATLLRETDPITYAATDETELHDLGRGLQIALFFMRPELKLALETYACYLLFKNRIPVAYGGGWSLGPQCRFGVNVLPPFRGGESTLLVAALLRVYAQRFRARIFVVEPYQIGRGNADGIRSASFWFYYRLGFRPLQRELATLAAREHARLAAGTRTPAPVLRQLAESLLVWPGTAREDWRYVSPAALGLVVTRHVEDRYSGDREAARRAATRALRARLPRQTPISAALRDWAILIDAIGGTAAWTPDELRGLVGLARRKSVAEAEYARRLQDHERFMASLQSLADPRRCTL